MVKRVTIVDIAKEANVSVSAVSKALMDAPDISNKTKELIRNTAEQLGYVQNISAASLKSGNSKMIAIICDSLLNPYYYEMIYYLEIHLSEKNYIVAIYRSNEFDMKIFNSILSRNFAGVISFITPNAEVETQLKKHSFPVVLLGRRGNSLSSICMDDYKVGKLAAEYFVNNNIKKPIYFGELKTFPITALRYKGFNEVLNDNNIKPIDYYKEKGIGVTDLIEKNEKMKNDLIMSDGIYCFSDIIAFEIIRYFRSIGKNPPMIIGVDNIQSEIPLPFSMLSISVNKEALVDKAIKILIDQINDRDTSVKILTEDVILNKANW